MLTGCGVYHKIRGNTTHTVQSESKATVVIQIDVSGCMELPVNDRANCIQAITGALKELSNVAKILACVRTAGENAGGESPNIDKSCWEMPSIEDAGP